MQRLAIEMQSTPVQIMHTGELMNHLSWDLASRACIDGTAMWRINKDGTREIVDWRIRPEEPGVDIDAVHMKRNHKGNPE